MIEESYLSYVVASITVLYIRLLIALIGQYKKRYKLYFIAQKHFNTKSSNRERHKALCASRAQNDVLEAARSHSAQLLIEKFKAQRKEILMRSLLILRDSLSLFF